MGDPLVTLNELRSAAPFLLIAWVAAILVLAALDVSLGDARGGTATRRWRLPLVMVTLLVYLVPFAFGALVGFPLVAQGRIVAGAAVFLLAPFAGVALAVLLKKAFVGLLGGRTRHLGPPPA